MTDQVDAKQFLEALRDLPAEAATDQAFFEACQEIGWHITPVHFSQAIPDTRTIPEEHWNSRSELPGVDLNVDAQREWLAGCSEFTAELAAFPDTSDNPLQYRRRQNRFRTPDADILYCMLRRCPPHRMIEVGSGMSTLLSLHALELNRNAGHPCRYTIVDPWPFGKLSEAVPGIEAIHDIPAQQSSLKMYEELERGDILFIDSSHVATEGTDVTWLICEVLPRLRPGVRVHFHDIFWPTPYPRPWVMENHWFWNEQYMLQAFLCQNPRWTILWTSRHMEMHHRSELESVFPHFTAPATPGSVWIERIE